MGRIALAVLLLVSLALAAELHEGGWVLGTSPYGASKPDFTPALNFDGALRFTLESTAKGQGIFKLLTVYDTPTNDSYEVEFEARVVAPGIDLDFNKQYPTGEYADNDGPNLFAFAYSYPNATLDSLPIGASSLSFYDKYNSLCHVHLECNFMAALEVAYDFYCRSEDPMSVYPGWVYDAQGFGSNVKVNEYNSEAFANDGWKRIRLYITEGDCLWKSAYSPKMTLMIMGADTLDKPYTWEIRNVKVSGVEIPLDYVYYSDGGNYTRIGKPQYCGDNERSGTEECDGAAGVEEGWICTSNCTLQAKCGDSMIVAGEVCDSTNVPLGFACSSDCRNMTAVCGDNVTVAGEACDSGNVTLGFRCSSDCKSMTAVCGDNITVGTEECDGSAGVYAGQGCTPKCGLYRLLSETEQEAVDSIIALIEASKPGVPSNDKLTIPKGNYTAEDIADQFILKNKTAPGNISFCIPGAVACEARYIFVEDAKATASGLAPLDDLNGIAKVYTAAANNSTTYYIGFKGGSGWLPFIEMDTTLWIAVGVLAVLALGAGVVFLLILGGYMYYTKGKGFEFKNIFKGKGA